MKKKILLILTMVALLVCVFVISVSAAECIDGIYYTFNGTEATVSSDNQGSCELETVVIPEKVRVGETEYTVTAIVGKAFGSQNKNGGNSNVKSVTVPSTVTSIGEYAFGNCPNLTEAYCKSEKIGSRMFIDCAALNTVTLENTVEIGGNAFNRAPLTSVVIPSTVTTVGDYAFKGCASLTKVVILGSIMGPYMFDGCSSLNTLVLTDEIETFGDKCFGTKTYGAFTTYYTGSDYDRVKELGSYTSRFSKAGCYSYSDYAKNNYTDTYMLIYETNLCVAAFDGNHTEPADDGNCSTPVICSVCSKHTYREAKEHVTIEKLAYTSFMEEGEYCVSCTNDGCTYGMTEKADALFVCLGYSVPEDGRDGITIGYSVNAGAIAEYTSITGNTLNYGIFAVAFSNIGDNDIVNADGSYFNKAIAAEVSSINVAAFGLRINGFETEDHKNAELTIGAYVIETDKDSNKTVSYLQNDTPNDGDRYSYVTYNGLTASES